MPGKTKVGVLGATGAVGQRFCQLLAHHPWFELAAVTASERSAGKRYAEAVDWRLSTPIPDHIGKLHVIPTKSEHMPGDVKIVFSALPGEVEQRSRHCMEMMASPSRVTPHPTGCSMMFRS